MFQFNSARNVHVEVLRCQFTFNSALWGGGLFVSFKSLAVGNTLEVKDTVFAHNKCLIGGGGMIIGFYDFAHRVQSNIVTIENVIFLNNSAGFGGGTTIFSDVVYQISHKNLNNVTFMNSTWINNFANFSTAVDVSPNVYNNIAGEFPLSTTFNDCSFIGNRNSRHKNTTKFYFRSETVMITIHVLLVEFGEKTIFEDNFGTALHVVATIVKFGHHSYVTFKNNSASVGGAIAFAGMASLVFNSYSTFLFQNNHADFVGGAIYWNSIDQYFSSRTCFLKKENNYKTRNVSFTFINNTAHSGIGHSIFATTLLPCSDSCSSYNLSLEEMFNKCVANFSFFGHNNKNSFQIATFGKQLNVNNPLKITPGIIFPLNATVYDEGHSDVTSITVFQNSIIEDNSKNMIQMPKSYEHSSLEIKIFGHPGSTGKLLIKVSGIQNVSTVVTIEVAECPPGFVLEKTLPPGVIFSGLLTFSCLPKVAI